MTWLSSVSKHLYLRIWLAVVFGVAVLMLLVGWAWSLSVEHVAHNGPQGVRELQVRNERGELLDSVPGKLQRGVGVNFEVTQPLAATPSAARWPNAGPRLRLGCC